MNQSVLSRGGVLATMSAAASTLVFIAFLVVGMLYIVVAKSFGVSPLWILLVPVLLILTYAVILGFARYLRLRDDQSGDNLYYLGFLFTLTSLGVTLWQFSASGGADAVVTNFGVAVSSTILGVALRVIFGQMRQDPLEVERSARLELAEAARRVRQELDETVLQFSSFRRATQQSLLDAAAEMKGQIELASGTVVEALKELPERSAAPLEGASRQTKETLAKFSSTLISGLEVNAARLVDGTTSLASAAETVTDALVGIQEQLKSMQMPDGIIEIKLQPTIRGLTKAIKDVTEKLGSQVDEMHSAVSATADEIAGAGRSFEAAATAQIQNSEQIAVLLSSTEDAFRQLSEWVLAGQQEQQKRDAALIHILEKLPGVHARFGLWPWTRR